MMFSDRIMNKLGLIPFVIILTLVWNNLTRKEKMVAWLLSHHKL